MVIATEDQRAHDIHEMVVQKEVNNSEVHRPSTIQYLSLLWSIPKGRKSSSSRVEHEKVGTEVPFLCLLCAMPHARSIAALTS